MISVALIAIFLVAAIIIFIIRPTFEDGGTVYHLWWSGIPLLLISLVIAAFSCTAIVQAKQVGVLTTFGKPSDRTLSSGLHLKAPWQKVTNIDATIQTDEYRGDDCITVRLGDGNTACVSATIRWAVNPENADSVYADFRSDDPTESLRDAVVSTQFKAAINASFAGYDPTDSLRGGNDGSFAPDYNAMANEVSGIMDTKTNELINIESITISYLRLDEKTQARIDAYQGEVAKTRNAQQAQQTAEEQAKANKILADSISNDPNVLVAQCLEMLAEGDFVAPAGFSCWPGGGTGIVIPGSPSQ